MSNIIVTGITTGVNPSAPVNDLPQRLEWHNFVQSIEQVTLYVKSLQQWMQTNQSSTPSYFQIAGIHGLPFIPWDGVQGDNPTAGYCNHGMVTFPTWHRPYVALYEQSLAGFFPGIIEQYSSSSPTVGQRLQAAAQTWRLPYWDWAANADIPAEWSNTQINILDTDGSTISIASPFNHYAFHPIDSSFKPYTRPNYAAWRMTLRQPTSATNPNASSQPRVSNRWLEQADFKQWMLDLFPTVLYQPDPWGQFSNHTWDQIHQGQGTLTSLESIHDTVHVDVGGQGHMGDPAVAAFDPIFWLHHCNVDRVLALWQAAYPNVYVSSGPDLSGTFVHQPDQDPNATDIDVNTPLEPFWKTQSQFASSTDCYSTGAYGYTYPEIAAAGSVSGDQLSQFIIQTIDNLYGGGSVFNAFSFPQRTVQRAVFPSGPAHAPIAATADRSTSTGPSSNTVETLRRAFDNIHIFPSSHNNVLHLQRRVGLPKSSAPPAHNPHPPSNPHPVSHLLQHNPGTAEHSSDYVVTPETYRDWIANVTLEKYALGGSGRVGFFLGSLHEIPGNPDEWHSSPIYVGSYVIFAQNPTQTGCDNCKDQADRHIRVGGTVHLTKALIRAHCPLVGDEPIEYLRENLHWKCANIAECRIIPNEEVAGLKVVVQSAGYEIPLEIGGRPVRGDWTRHAPVTAGKPGGVNHPDAFNH